MGIERKAADFDPLDPILSIQIVRLSKKNVTKVKGVAYRWSHESLHLVRPTKHQSEGGGVAPSVYGKLSNDEIRIAKYLSELRLLAIQSISSRIIQVGLMRIDSYLLTEH